MLNDEIINKMDVDELRNVVHHLNKLLLAHGKAKFALTAERDTLLKLYRDTEFRADAVRALDALWNACELVFDGMRDKYLRGDKSTSFPTAKWIEDGYENLPTVCSRCGSPGVRDWKYCPYCGARMNVEDADDETN